MFSEITLNSIGLDIANMEVIMFEFTISLLGATIQDRGIREVAYLQTAIMSYVINC